MNPLQTDEDESRGARRWDPALWRELWRTTRPYRREVWLLAGAAAGTAAADVGYPLVTGGIIDDVVANGVQANFVLWSTLFMVLTFALAFFVRAFIRLGGRIRTGVAHDIRRDGFENLQRLSFSFYDHRPVGWLMARMTSDCERLSNILAWGVLDFVWGAALMSGIAGVMLFLDARLALIALGVIPVLILVSALFQKHILASSRVVRKTNSKITAAYNEGIMGVRTSKTFVREGENLDEFRGLTETMYEASVRNQIQSALFLPIVLTLGSIATGLALHAGGVDVTVGRITIGTLIVFVTYTARFFEPIQEMAHWFAEMQMAQASAERILGLIEEEPAIQDSPSVRAALTSGSAAPLAGTAPDGRPDTIGTIEFRGVDFAYGEGTKVLADFDLTVRAGEMIALVGSTGGGKSTIVNLLCRFYEPTGGEILIDGVDYRERSLAWLQSNLGIVLQEPHLFSGSLLENIRYGNLAATDDEVISAAQLVGAHEFVTALEGGYKTEVGEGGVRLSTGEKQLVSFARAILARPRILVMDEATSSVDTETERRIQTGLEQVLAGRTSFVIAHRLSTIRAADRILVIEKGHIAEAGTHAELLRLGGRYRDLATNEGAREAAQNEEVWSGS